MKKNKVLIMRLTEEEDNQIRKSAELGSITVSDYVRMKIFGTKKVDSCPECGGVLIDSVISSTHIIAGDPVQRNKYYTTCQDCGWTKETTDYQDYIEGKTLDPRD